MPAADGRARDLDRPAAEPSGASARGTPLRDRGGAAARSHHRRPRHVARRPSTRGHAPCPGCLRGGRGAPRPACPSGRAPGDRHLVAAEPRGGRVPRREVGRLRRLRRHRPHPRGITRRRRRCGRPHRLTRGACSRGIRRHGRAPLVRRTPRTRTPRHLHRLDGDARTHDRPPARTPRLRAAVPGHAPRTRAGAARRRARTRRPRRAPATRGRGAAIHGPRRRARTPRRRRREREARRSRCDAGGQVSLARSRPNGSRSRPASSCCTCPIAAARRWRTVSPRATPRWA